MKRTTFIYELDEGQQKAILEIMERGNYKRKEVPYSLGAIEGDHFNATLYSKEKHGKRKFCVQGAGASDFVEFVLEPQVLGAATLGYEDVVNPESVEFHAGSDESGKGDYFGPLVVCCAHVDPDLAVKMREIGVRDCKQMTDKAVMKTAAELRGLLGPNGYAIVMLRPPAYNRLYAKMKNINRMLAWAHATAIEDFLVKRPDCGRVVIDQFAKTEATILRALKPLAKGIKVEQRHKAESDLAVAAASILARDAFLAEVVGKKDAVLPTGSSSDAVAATAVKEVKENGPLWLMNNAKAHFSITDKVLAECGLTREALPPEGRVVSALARDSVNKRKGE